MTYVIRPVPSAISVTRGNPSLEEKYGKIDHFSSSDGFPRVTDNTRTCRSGTRRSRGDSALLSQRPCIFREINRGRDAEAISAVPSSGASTRQRPPHTAAVAPAAVARWHLKKQRACSPPSLSLFPSSFMHIHFEQTNPKSHQFLIVRLRRLSPPSTGDFSAH